MRDFWKSYRIYLIVFISYLFILILFFWKVFLLKSDSRLYLVGDFQHFFAGFYFFKEQLSVGIFPFWNPYMYQGHPFIARMDLGLLNPLSLLFTLIGVLFSFGIEETYVLYEIYTIFLLALSGTFMFALGKDLKLSSFASFLSGLVFILSGTLLAFLNVVSYIASIALLPLIFLLYRRFLKYRFSLLYFSLLVLVLGLSHFFGYLQISFFYTGFFLFLYTGFYTLSKKNELKPALKDLLIKSLRLGFIFLFSLLLYSIQLFPALQFIPLSSRNNLSLNTALFYGAVEPFHLIDLFLPNFFVNKQLDTIVTYSYSYLYLGIFPLFLFSICVLIRTKKSLADKAFYIFSFMFFLLASFGGFSSLYDFLYLLVPGFSKFRIFSKFLLYSGLSFAILAGLGYDHITHFIAEQEKKRVAKYLRIVLLFISFTLLLSISSWLDLFSHFGGDSKYVYTNELTYPLNKLMLFVLFALISVFIIHALLFRFGNKVLIGLVIVGFLLVDFATFNRDILTNNSQTRPLDYYSKETSFAKLTSSSQEFPRLKFLTCCYGAQYGPNVLNVYNADGYSSLVLGSVIDDIIRIGKKDPATCEWAQDWASRGVSYFVAEKEMENPCLSLADVTVIDDSNVSLHKKYIRDGMDLGIRSSGDKIYTYKNTEFKHGLLGTSSPFEIVGFNANEVVININASSDMETLTLMYPYYSGWNAYVDGLEVDLIKSEIGYMSINVPEGVHTVRFKFSPPLFYFGLVVSILSTLTFISLAMKGKKLEDA